MKSRSAHLNTGEEANGEHKGRGGGEEEKSRGRLWGDGGTFTSTMGRHGGKGSGSGKWGAGAAVRKIVRGMRKNETKKLEKTFPALIPINVEGFCNGLVGRIEPQTWCVCTCTRAHIR